MIENLTTEKIVKRLKFVNKIGILLTIAGIITFLLKNHFSDGVFSIIGKSLDSVFMIVMGIVTFILSKREIVNVDGNRITFYENGFSCKIKGNEYQFNQENKPKAIDIKLKIIEIITSDDTILVLNLDYYATDFVTRKKIKETFAQYKQGEFLRS